MNDNPQPDFDRQLAGLLNEAITGVELAPAARTRIAARLRAVAKPAPNLWAWLLPATTAAVVLAAVGFSLWRGTDLIAQKSHEPSWIVCQATTYSATDADQWVRRSLLAHRRNGTESFIAVSAVRSLPNPNPNLQE